MTVTAKVVGQHIVPKEEYEYIFADFLPPNIHKSKRFNNQYTICIPVGPNGRRLNVKIFGNGTLQISGAKSMADVHELATVLMLQAHMDIGEYKIAMINSNFDCKYRIRLYELALYMRQLGMHVHYDNQRHPGMHLRYMYNRQNPFANGICSCVIGFNPTTRKIDRRFTKCECHKVSVIIFATGKIVITGAASIVHILEVHEYLMSRLDKYKDTDPIPTRMKRRGTSNRRVQPVNEQG